MMKREYLSAKILSISSDCLIKMLIRTEFTEGSINTFSVSLRQMSSGLRMAALVVLQDKEGNSGSKVSGNATQQ